MIACEKLTKCREGRKNVRHCSHCGWLSTGVVPPERSCIATTTKMISSENCAIERAMVPRKIPNAVVKNR